MGRPLRCCYADRLAHVMFHTLDHHFFSNEDLRAFVAEFSVLVARYKMKIRCWNLRCNGT